MTFTETPFWILAAATFALWLMCRRSQSQVIALLLIASAVFYGYHNWSLLPLILTYCVVNWGVALGFQKTRTPRLLLGLGVGFNLAVLAYWKYTPLLLSTAARICLRLNWTPPSLASASWTTPFGISFYAFTGIAYMVDVFRGLTTAERSLPRYVLSAIFFPHLVAGPILRPNEFLERLRPLSMPDRPEAPLEAAMLLARGFFKKVVLADRVSRAIDPFFVHVGDASTAGVWSLPYVYLYALQIYLDFSAYTDIARGLGLLFGYRWPENFYLPYLATSIQEFWRRWHITLSRFLRDYLYVALGGNRRGPVRTYANLMITMLLGGLWHGASWSFLLWGGLHGCFLVINRLWSESRVGRGVNVLADRISYVGGIWTAFCWLLTFHCVCLAWCFFRLSNLAESLACVRKTVRFDPQLMWVGGAFDPSLIALVAYALFVWIALRPAKKLLATGWRPTPTPLMHGFVWGFSLSLLLLALLLSPGGESPAFIYFQF
ncbi:MBOAT family protein [soil metagenome]